MNIILYASIVPALITLILMIKTVIEYAIELIEYMLVG